MSYVMYGAFRRTFPVCLSGEGVSRTHFLTLFYERASGKSLGTKDDTIRCSRWSNSFRCNLSTNIFVQLYHAAVFLGSGDRKLPWYRFRQAVCACAWLWFGLHGKEFAGLSRPCATSMPCVWSRGHGLWWGGFFFCLWTIMVIADLSAFSCCQKDGDLVSLLFGLSPEMSSTESYG